MPRKGFDDFGAEAEAGVPFLSCALPFGLHEEPTGRLGREIPVR